MGKFTSQHMCQLIVPLGNDPALSPFGHGGRRGRCLPGAPGSHGSQQGLAAAAKMLMG